MTENQGRQSHGKSVTASQICEKNMVTVSSISKVSDG